MYWAMHRAIRRAADIDRLSGMTEIDNIAAQLRTPPCAQLIKKWHPHKILDIDLRIDGNGNWFYRGSPIARKRMVKLFGALLRIEHGEYFLITPHLKYPIRVDDAPFCAVELTRHGNGIDQNLIFRTNVDDKVLADRDHPISIAADNLAPYLHIRDGLRAKICRAVYYELTELLVRNKTNDTDGDALLGVYSGGEFFTFGHG